MPAALGYQNEAVKEIMYYEMFNHKTIGHIQRMTFAEVQSYITDFESKSLKSREELDADANQLSEIWRSGAV